MLGSIWWCNPIELKIFFTLLFCFQISTNAQEVWATVTTTLIAPILMDHTNVSVTMDTKETVSTVQVISSINAVGNMHCIKWVNISHHRYPISLVYVYLVASKIYQARYFRPDGPIIFTPKNSSSSSSLPEKASLKRFKPHNLILHTFNHAEVYSI